MCNNIKLFKKYHELPNIIIQKNDSELDRCHYYIYIRMIKKNCNCPAEFKFREEQLNH